MAETGKTIHLEIITPDAAVLNTDVSFVLVRALDGDLGIMPGHAPLIASLRIWPLVYEKDGKRNCVCVASGFLEVNGNTITVIKLPADIDLDRAEQSRARAEKRLQEKKENLDEARAQASLKRALLRIDVAHKYGGK